VLELVGAPSLGGVLPHLGVGARVVVIGVGGGAQIDLNLFSLMGKRARIGGSTLRARSRREKGNVAAAVAAHVVPLLADGRVRVPVCETFPMADAQRAYERFVAGAKLGKVVLVNEGATGR
jgi:NADPH:quinone reductase-like Zn-dependent oxidoreductase